MGQLQKKTVLKHTINRQKNIKHTENHKHSKISHKKSHKTHINTQTITN